MSTKMWIGTVLAAVAWLAWSCAQDTGTRDRPPNILLIVADDMRADALGVAGNADIHTPNLDRLAGESVYFTKATAFVAQCCPWRAMIITGLTPRQSGYISMDIQEGRRGEHDGFDDVPTVPGLLRGAGYRTVLVGKWHLKPDPWRCGFDEIRHWLPEGMGPYENPSLCFGASRDEKVTAGYVAEIFADDAIGFLKSPQAKEKPFFLMLTPTEPHEPCEPTPERIGEFYKGKTSEDLVRPGIGKGASARWKDKWLPYYRAVTHLDEQVGRVLRELDAAGLAGTTVVIFTSDSGIMMGRRGIDSKVVPYEDSVRVPLIVRDPRVKAAARRSAATVTSLDLPPTILALAGVNQPPRWAGRDLRGAIAQGTEAQLGGAVSMWVDDHSAAWGKYGYRSLFDGRYKLIVWADAAKGAELYDVDADPHEERNLAGEEGERLADMKSRLRSWLTKTGDDAATWSALTSPGR